MAAARTAEPVTASGRPSPAPPTAPRPGARGVVLAGLVLAAVACLVLAALTVPRLSAAGDREDRRGDVLQAARQHAVNFTTLDYRQLDRDLGRVLDGATGEFRKEFEAGTEDLSELVTSNEAVSEGRVLEAGIVTDDDDSARVLVVADSTVRNTATEEPQRRHYRLQLDLVRDGDRWLVSDLQFVG